MAHILVTESLAHGKKKSKKTTLGHEVKIGVHSLLIFNIIIICVLTVTYIIHSNKTATTGYVLKQLEDERKRLVIQSEVWDMKISRAQSLLMKKSSPTILSMQQISDPLFTRGDSAVAMKKR